MLAEVFSLGRRSIPSTTFVEAWLTSKDGRDMHRSTRPEPTLTSRSSFLSFDRFTSGKAWMNFLGVVICGPTKDELLLHFTRQQSAYMVIRKGSSLFSGVGFEKECKDGSIVVVAGVIRCKRNGVEDCIAFDAQSTIRKYDATPKEVYDINNGFDHDRRVSGTSDARP
ncbi:hypothetical protein sr14825 [Sporisorium reilianum SRZ2]|uniref:Uncharacterized protein n=1 Tax=Sporisorium reilianum (strain SRZ2) TaxID=999809 RepID=E6ZMS9_SPORE|nr:hypothetical protein sr14825 [Sporisorium reilianum SRZ2]